MEDILTKSQIKPTFDEMTSKVSDIEIRLEEASVAATSLKMTEFSKELTEAAESLSNLRGELRQLGNELSRFVEHRSFNGDNIIQKLRELRQLSEFKNASFGFSTEKVNSNPHMQERVIGVPVDEFIKERTKLYRLSWIIPLIDELIGVANGEVKIERY